MPKVREGQSREAAEPHGPHARGDDGRGGRRPANRRRPRRPRRPRRAPANPAAGPPAAAQSPTRRRRGRRDALAREASRHAREAAAPATAAAAKAGHKQAVGDLGPAGPPSPAAKKRKTGKAATASAAADSDDDVRIIGETFGRPTSVVEDVDDDEDVDVDAYLASRGVYVTSLTDRGGALAASRPSFVVTYDPDAAFIREIETHKASRPGAPMRVYFLVHDTSLEEQRYLSSVRYETEAFDALIRAKQHMAMPAEQEGRVNGGVGIPPERDPDAADADDAVVDVSGGGVRVPHGSHHGLWTVDGPHAPSSLLAEHLASEPAALPLPQLAPLRDSARDAAALDTRRRGGQLSAPSTPRLVVDVREFMGSLPSILHQSGFKLMPATIEVGDYVLSRRVRRAQGDSRPDRLAAERAPVQPGGGDVPPLQDPDFAHRV